MDYHRIRNRVGDGLATVAIIVISGTERRKILATLVFLNGHKL